MVVAAVLNRQVAAVNQRGARRRSYRFAVELKRESFTGGNCDGACQTDIVSERDSFAGIGGGNRKGERSVSYAADFADRIQNLGGDNVQSFTGGALQRNRAGADLNDNVRAADDRRIIFRRDFERVTGAEIVNHVVAFALGVAEKVRAAAGINHVVARAGCNGISRAAQAYRVVARARFYNCVGAAAGNRIAAGRRIVRNNRNVAADSGNIPRSLSVEVRNDLLNGGVERVGIAGC